jgi:hypothetical protein
MPAIRPTRPQDAGAMCGVRNAITPADNTGGLRFYSGLGFTAYATDAGVPLSDGRPVDRICHRFDL